MTWHFIGFSVPKRRCSGRPIFKMICLDLIDSWSFTDDTALILGGTMSGKPWYYREAFCWRRAEYTVRNVDTKPALFRANTKRDLLHGFPRKFTFLFVVNYLDGWVCTTIEKGPHPKDKCISFKGNAAFVQFWLLDKTYMGPRSQRYHTHEKIYMV